MQRQRIFFVMKIFFIFLFVPSGTNKNKRSTNKAKFTIILIMQTITFEELNKNTCLRFTHDSDQVMVTFLQADICLIAAADKQKFIADMQVVIERYAQLPTFNSF